MKTPITPPSHKLNECVRCCESTAKEFAQRDRENEKETKEKKKAVCREFIRFQQVSAALAQCVLYIYVIE